MLRYGYGQEVRFSCSKYHYVYVKKEGNFANVFIIHWQNAWSSGGDQWLRLECNTFLTTGAYEGEHKTMNGNDCIS